MAAMKRRQYGTGSIYREHTTACPPAVVVGRDDDGKPICERPPHPCKGRFVGAIDAGYTAQGRRRRVRVVGKSEAEVRGKMKKRAAELARGASSAPTRVTVKSWAERWLEMTVREQSPNYHTTDRGAVDKWIVPTIGSRRIDRLTPADRRAVVHAVEAAGLSSTTAARYDGVLNRMLKAATQEGIVVPPLVLGTKAPTKGASDREAMPLTHALAVLAIAAHELPHASRWMAALLQGMRQGECLGLPWDEIRGETLTVCWQLQKLPYNIPRDRSSGFRTPRGYEARQLVGGLHLVRPKSKAGWRVIPIVEPMAEALEAWRSIAPESPHGLVWPALSGRPAHDAQDRDEWYGLQGYASIGHPAGRYYKLHEARHTTATLLMSLKVPDTVRQAIMGHSSIAVTRGYEHADLDLAREALGRVAARLRLGQSDEALPALTTPAVNAEDILEEADDALPAIEAETFDDA